ncbi:uncharacterized protein LOC112495041 [Cephus cinctus]|uniref:Uncharacterized protein LOC112495041 n=1 Tax=Cephus cinctus TaxID=211228 RepID=A0AAJ7RRS2_CEPCN|nr:uncharacterized protein LOC112495041 [Cephus cinctus]
MEKTKKQKNNEECLNVTSRTGDSQQATCEPFNFHSSSLFQLNGGRVITATDCGPTVSAKPVRIRENDYRCNLKLAAGGALREVGQGLAIAAPSRVCATPGNQ